MCRCCSRPCWAFFLALLAFVIIAVGCVVPWFLETLETEEKVYEDHRIMINLVFWWRQVYQEVYLDNSKEDDLSGTIYYSDHKLDNTERLFLVTMCLMIAAGVCTLFAVIATLYIFVRYWKRRVFASKFVAVILALLAVALVVAACAYFTRLPDELHSDQKNNGVLIMPSNSNDFWRFETDQLSIFGTNLVEVKIYWGPLGWYLPLVGCVFLLTSSVLVCLTRSAYNYDYAVLN